MVKRYDGVLREKDGKSYRIVPDKSLVAVIEGFAFRAVGFNGGMGFRISTRGDSQNNITRYTGPLTGDVEHDVVYTFKLNGSSGDLTVWLDAKKVLDLHGVPIGSLTEDGYSFSFGPYGQLHGNLVTAEYGNIAPFPSTADLSSRISAPPVW
jgi:hypothetical protein